MPLVHLTTRGPVLAAPWRSGAQRPGPANCFVSHTVFTHDRWRDLPAIARDAERAARLFSTQPGSVALAQWTLPGRRLLGDLSVWRSEDDLRAFLVHPDHLSLVERWQGRMRGEHHSWTAPPDRRAIWARAVELVRGG